MNDDERQGWIAKRDAWLASQRAAQERAAMDERVRAARAARAASPDRTLSSPTTTTAESILARVVGDDAQRRKPTTSELLARLKARQASASTGRTDEAAQPPSEPITSAAPLAASGEASQTPSEQTDAKHLSCSFSSPSSLHGNHIREENEQDRYPVPRRHARGEENEQDRYRDVLADLAAASPVAIRDEENEQDRYVATSEQRLAALSPEQRAELQRRALDPFWEGDEKARVEHEEWEEQHAGLPDPSYVTYLRLELWFNEEQDTWADGKPRKRKRSAWWCLKLRFTTRAQYTTDESGLTAKFVNYSTKPRAWTYEFPKRAKVTTTQRARYQQRHDEIMRENDTRRKDRVKDKPKDLIGHIEAERPHYDGSFHGKWAVPYQFSTLVWEKWIDGTWRPRVRLHLWDRTYSFLLDASSLDPTQRRANFILHIHRNIDSYRERDTP